MESLTLCVKRGKGHAALSMRRTGLHLPVCEMQGKRALLKTNKQGATAMLFCLTAQYTPHALNAILDDPSTNRAEAVNRLLEAAGAKLVSMYSTVAEGPGVMVIFDADSLGHRGGGRRRAKPETHAAHDAG
jgi:hypothetical protein